MDIPRAIRDARRHAGVTQTELAVRSGTAQTAISAYEHGAKMPTTTTLARILAAAGTRLTTGPASCAVRVPTSQELQTRGGVLAQALDLAGRLPARPSQDLRFPRLRRNSVG